ncbi:hypothetical protein HYV31_01070 [candidate division WWE3 bacterium]|nr:hypothetical protein [candidate division WWE3 bacterium]
MDIPRYVVMLAAVFAILIAWGVVVLWSKFSNCDAVFVEVYAGATLVETFELVCVEDFDYLFETYPEADFIFKLNGHQVDRETVYQRLFDREKAVNI